MTADEILLRWATRKLAATASMPGGWNVSGHTAVGVRFAMEPGCGDCGEPDDLYAYIKFEDDTECGFMLRDVNELVREILSVAEGPDAA